MSIKKVISFLILSTIILSLVACNTTKSPTEQMSTPSPTPSASISTEPTAEPEPESNLDEYGEFRIEMPLSNDPITITAWCTAPDPSAGMVTHGDSVAYKELAKRTNVSIEWTHPVAGEEITSFNLLLASQSYTDMIAALAQYWVGGIPKYYEMGVINDLTPYAEHMQNYMKKRTMTDDTIRRTSTNENRILFLMTLKELVPYSFGGFIVRGDIADSLGIDTDNIKTFDDWYAMLTTFKGSGMSTLDSPYVPFFTGVNTLAGIDPILMTGYNVMPGIFQTNSVVKFGPVMDEYKEYIKMVQKWFAEGLFDAEFFSRGPGQLEPALFNGKAVVSAATYTNIDRYDLLTVSDTSQPDWRALPSPTVKRGDTFNTFLLASKELAMASTHVITTNCDEKTIPIILKMWDYLFTKEGSLLFNYGIEGETYDLDANGKPSYKEFVLHDPDGMSMAGGFAKYSMLHGTNPALFDPLREISSGISEKAFPNARIIWDEGFDYQGGTPQLDIPTELSADYTIIINDCTTYIQEWTARTITTGADVDAEWDGYIDQLKSMRINEAIKMAQDSYDLYLARDLTVGYTEEQVKEYNIGFNETWDHFME